MPLPIHKHLPDIKAALRDQNTLILQAPPGAGKTTLVPLALLKAPWLKNTKIILLEPRRLAAVSCANHMAHLLGEKTGQTVGYQIRLDVKKSARTRILVVTEGIFTRMIQNDPGLEKIGLVIFDEFHERSIHSDLGLALVKETQEVLRPDLRVLIMSATIDTARLSQLLDHAPVIHSKGRVFPVKTIYQEDLSSRADQIPIPQKCAGAVKKALKETKGDILVFLPGVGEIRQLESLLKSMENDKIIIFPLYGNLPAKAQGAVFNPAPKGKRKIIIATAIAETSITIDGVQVVIDSGLMRQPRFSPQTGMSRLETVAVSKASADQRRGRAGRTGAGVCFRLWSEYEHKLLKPFSKPEIAMADLAGVALELAAWGILEPDGLKWLDIPDQASYKAARSLLYLLGAVDENGKITRHGKSMAGSGLHPRLSHMVLAAKESGLGFTACRLAALLMEKDILITDRGEYEPDIDVRLAVLDAKVDHRSAAERYHKINRNIISKIHRSEVKIARDAGIRPGKVNEVSAGRALAYAFPDRIAKKRDARHQTYLTASGKGCYFVSDTLLAQNDFIVALNLDGNPTNARIFTGAAYRREWLELDFPDQIKVEQSISWDASASAVQQTEKHLFERLVLQKKKVPVKDLQKACDILAREIKKAGLKVLPWGEKQLSLKTRAWFLKNTGKYPKLPDLSDPGLLAAIDQWLMPFLEGIFSFRDLKKFLNMASVMSALLSWQDRQTIEKEAPAHLIVPGGSKIRLIYEDRNGILDAPVLKVRLQEMFGLEQTPKVASDTVDVVIHLLSPAGRAVQITKDLKSFWKNTYQQVRKDLMGRYPKHYWPDDPYKAVATNRVRPGK